MAKKVVAIAPTRIVNLIPFSPVMVVLYYIKPYLAV